MNHEDRCAAIKRQKDWLTANAPKGYNPEASVSPYTTAFAWWLDYKTAIEVAEEALK